MRKQVPSKQLKKLVMTTAIIISFLVSSVLSHIGVLAGVVGVEGFYCESCSPYDNCECIHDVGGNEPGDNPGYGQPPEPGDSDDVGSGSGESNNQGDGTDEDNPLPRNPRIPRSGGILRGNLIDDPILTDNTGQEEEEYVGTPEDTTTDDPEEDSTDNLMDEEENPVTLGRTLIPSSDFIDLANRTRFHVDSQIEGLPPFINMEMIVGVLRAQDTYGFPASVAIAQIIQEGGYGSYGPGGELGLGLSRLSYRYNNLFGIKGVGPAGSVSMRTFEMTSAGETYFINDYFRVYNTFTDSIMDRSQLLLEEYWDLIEGVTNANEFAWNIGRRWATDINYASSLIRHMEVYDLYRLDEMTLYEYHELIGAGRFIHPVPGSTVTSVFGWRPWDNAYHRGIDFGTGALNLPIYAVESGVVTFVGYSVTAGNWIVIYHGSGLYTKYMHNFANFVEVGQRVERGQQIALTGNTGHSTGNHLHFEVHLNGQAINPILLLGLGF